MTVGQLCWNKVLKSGGQNFFLQVNNFLTPFSWTRRKIFKGLGTENFSDFFQSRSFLTPFSWRGRTFFEERVGMENFQIFQKVTHILPPSPVQEEIFSRGSG